jgi:hypothetical protein
MQARTGNSADPIDSARFFPAGRIVIDDPTSHRILPGGLSQRFIGPKRAHSGNAWMPVYI